MVCSVERNPEVFFGASVKKKSYCVNIHNPRWAAQIDKIFGELIFG
jgi:hypothetical protein